MDSVESLTVCRSAGDDVTLVFDGVDDRVDGQCFFVEADVHRVRLEGDRYLIDPVEAAYRSFDGWRHSRCSGCLER